MTRPDKSAVAVIGCFCLASLVTAQQARWRSIPDLSGRSGFAMASDPVRQRVVLFGGYGRLPLNFRGDTWEWDGTRWHRFTPKVSPEPRAYHKMAYDWNRNTVLLFGGYEWSQANGERAFGDTWEWDGRAWRQLQGSGGPPARFWHGMASDPRRKRTVLFGGQTGAWPAPILDDTWEWDGLTWKQAQPRTRPLSRIQFGMAWDPSSSTVMMLGGLHFTPVPDTFHWQWDGVDWRRRTSKGYPANRYDMALAPVPGTNTVAMFGGYRRSFQTNELWIWDGVDWTLAPPSTQDPPALPTDLAADEAGRQVVLMGLAPEDDGQWRTWAWSGKAWRVVDAFRYPRGYRVAYDGARDQLLVVGYAYRGRDSITETLALRDGRFVDLQPKAQPPWNLLASNRWHLIQHAASGQVVLLTGETWVWNGVLWTKVADGPYSSAAVAYDARRRNIIQVQLKSSQLAEWDPVGWKTRAFTGGPPYRYDFSLGYDAGRDRLVLFGGRDSNQQDLNDTWEWDGARWIERKPRHRPPARVEGQIVYFPPLGGSVLFGGYTGLTPFGDVWLWDGADWRELKPGRSVDNFNRSAYDVGRQRIVAIRAGAVGNVDYPRIWQLDLASLTSPQPYPRPGETTFLDVELQASAGRPFVLGLSHALRPGIPLRPVAGLGVELLPLAPGPFLQASVGAGLGGVLNAQGRASVPLPIPNNPWLLWQEFHAAGVSLGTSGLGEITRAQTIRIVR